MHPELFRIPFTPLTVKSYGVLMVCGFVSAIYIIRRLSRGMGENAEHVTSAALYSLVAGVVGARIFYVVHYWYQFRERPLDVFAVWDGGVELLGGVLLAIFVIAVYLRTQKLPVRRYLDILAVGLMLALAFGRIGCFFSGCCFGKPTTCPVSIRFPYGSNAYQSQIRPDVARGREKPYLELPAEYFGYVDENDQWVSAPEEFKYEYYLKPPDRLTEQQKLDVTQGPYRCLAVYPTQFFSSFAAFVICILLYTHRSIGIKLQNRDGKTPLLFRSGVTFALMFILYGVFRFFIEFLRDDNPIGADGLTISQNLGIGLVILGFIMIAVFSKMKPDKIPSGN